MACTLTKHKENNTLLPLFFLPKFTKKTGKSTKMSRYSLSQKKVPNLLFLSVIFNCFTIILYVGNKVCFIKIVVP